MKKCCCTILAVSFLWVSSAEGAEDYRIARKAVFAFAQKPVVERNGDQTTIRFASKDYCDVTVVVEGDDGRIIRYLVSGVLGSNAPAPLKKDALEQTLLWDGKDEQGQYVENLDRVQVRVSLGLKPRFERTLFWSPQRRQSRWPQLVSATKEGVYVYDGGRAGIDHLRLFDHDGGYVKTIYPFASDKIKNVKGLAWHTYPEDGKTLPVKTNFLQSTMLTSGLNACKTQTYDSAKNIYRSSVAATGNAHYGYRSPAGSAMAVRNGRIALAQVDLNRLGTDGASAGLELKGPKSEMVTWPKSIAVGPEGKWLYLTGYIHGDIKQASQNIRYSINWRCVPVVMRMNLETNGKMEVFKGNPGTPKPGDPFKVPSSVAVDAKGRVYVTDHIADQVLIYSSGGKLLKTIPIRQPAKVCIHQTTGEMYVFCFKVMNTYNTRYFKGSLHRFGPFEKPQPLQSWALGTQIFTDNFASRYRTGGLEFFAELDGWTDPPTLWMTTEGRLESVATQRREANLSFSNLVLLQPKGKKLVVMREFARDVERAGLSPLGQVHQRQRLYVNPKNRHLYVAEGDENSNAKSFSRLYEINPETGSVRKVELPFHAEDLCFDLNGLAYLRTVNVVVRYDPATDWREVPWDYGEERERVGFGWSSGTRTAHVISGIIMPSDGNWHHGGMYVSPKGHLAVACLLGYDTQVRTKAKYVHRDKPYKPKVFPGRLLAGRAGATCVHVWDRHGKVIYEDALPGLADLYGIALDRNDNIQVMSAATRILNGKRHFNDMTGAVIKMRPMASRVLTDSRKVPVPLAKENHPQRSYDLVSSPQYTAWVQNAEWFYGGIGFGGKNKGNGCACSNFRFAHDYLARTFAPEMHRYSIAVLDDAGNLITRIGTYGNVDEGKPLHAEGGPPQPKSIGGDEVALFHGAYLATETDRRLFIADPGNARILSVRLGYHAEARIPLRGE